MAKSKKKPTDKKPKPKQDGPSANLVGGRPDDRNPPKPPKP